MVNLGHDKLSFRNKNQRWDKFKGDGNSCPYNLLFDNLNSTNEGQLVRKIFGISPEKLFSLKPRTNNLEMLLIGVGIVPKYPL